MNKTTVQDLIDFYEEKRQEYKDSAEEREEELTRGQLEEPDAFFIQKELEMDRLTVGIVNGFLENLRKLEESE